MMVTEILIVVAVLWGFVEVSTILAMGLPISNKEKNSIRNLAVSDVRLNYFDNRILSLNGAGYIAQPPFSILFKYYSNDKGVIWRFSATAKHIDSLFKELNK